MEKNFYDYLIKHNNKELSSVLLSEESVERLKDCARMVKLSKGELLQIEGEVSQIWGFVTEGLIRTYYKKEENEVTDQLAHEGDDFIDYKSFFREVPSSCNIQTIEPSVVFIFKKKELDAMCEKDKDIKKLFTLLKKKNLLKLKERLDDSVFEPAKEKFSSLMEKTPQFVLRVPSIYIASYLGITPETLSRIRAKMKIDERNV